MKKIIFAVCVLSISCNSSRKTVTESKETTSTNSNASIYAKSITEAELKTYLYTYASDEFEGRETGQPGQKKAAAYLKEAYIKMGVPAAKGGKNYFQNVPLEIKKAPKGFITIDNNKYVVGEDFLTFSVANDSFSEIIYAGYGIVDNAYSDYKNLDIKGKIVLIKSGEPKLENGSYVISGSTKTSVWSDPSKANEKRMKIAKEKGAKGVIYYDQQNYSRYLSYFNRMKSNANGRMSLKKATTDNFITVYINSKLAIALNSSIDKEATSKTLATEITFNVTSDSQDINSENVAAIIKGSEKPNEYLIISSHLDHIGISKNGEINNGADDDGSGTVALLEIAQAFKKAADAGNGPKRSIVFLHVTGEEKGLFGSQYYTDIEPIFPLEQTVANLNIDMVGRIDPKREGDRNYIYLIGSDKLSTDLHNISEKANSEYTKIELDYKFNDENDPNRFYYRSDHYNFAKNNIPVIFYFNGTHDDYHRPSDTADKINYDLLENRSRLIFYTAWDVANRKDRVAVDKVAK
ncbi:MAG: M28 family peptidase [Cellulophaga sp.]